MNLLHGFGESFLNDVAVRLDNFTQNEDTLIQKFDEFVKKHRILGLFSQKDSQTNVRIEKAKTTRACIRIAGMESNKREEIREGLRETKESKDESSSYTYLQSVKEKQEQDETEQRDIELSKRNVIIHGDPIDDAKEIAEIEVENLGEDIGVRDIEPIQNRIGIKNDKRLKRPIRVVYRKSPKNQKVIFRANAP